ncbi:hypothetical protein GOODEAATRI_025929, partial [Goodea atripinnis]
LLGGQLGGGGKGNPGGKCFRFRYPFSLQKRNPNTRVLKLHQKRSQPSEPGTVPVVLLYFLQVPPSREEATGAIFSLLEGEFTIADQCSLEEALDIFSAGQESGNFTFETVTDNTTAPLLRTEDTETGASQLYLN